MSGSGAARGEGHPGGYPQESGRELAPGTAVRTAPAGGALSDVSGKDPGLRSAIAGTSGVVRIGSGPESAADRAQAEGQEGQQERSPVRFTDGVVSHHRYRLGTSERHRCADGADSNAART